MQNKASNLNCGSCVQRCGAIRDAPEGLSELIFETEFDTFNTAFNETPCNSELLQNVHSVRRNLQSASNIRASGMSLEHPGSIPRALQKQGYSRPCDAASNYQCNALFQESPPRIDMRASTILN